jgi:TonB family protein
MKNLILTLLVIFSTSVFAQKRQYLDEYEIKLPSPKGAKYYRLVEPQGTLYRVRDFYASNDQPNMVATASEVNPRIKYEGKYKSFYENGQIENEGEYKDNECNGPWKSYHENGQLAEERIHQGDTTIYKQYWDNTGKALLVDGTGVFSKKASPMGELCTYEVLNSLLLAVYFVDEVNRDSIYLHAERSAEYKGGPDGLSKKIATTLVYPKKARRMGVQGVVYISFLVDQEGKVRDAKCIKGIGGGCDEEAMKVVSQLHNWIPGHVKDKPVIQSLVQPISFKLR